MRPVYIIVASFFLSPRSKTAGDYFRRYTFPGSCCSGLAARGRRDPLMRKTVRNRSSAQLNEAPVTAGPEETRTLVILSEIGANATMKSKDPMYFFNYQGCCQFQPIRQTLSC